MLRFHKLNYGFSLIEISMALIIIASITGGVLSMSLVQNEKALKEQTENKLEVIENSLMAFISVHKRLPCPADPALGEDDENFGVERCNCLEFGDDATSAQGLPSGYSCPSAQTFSGGDVPFKTLSLPRQFAKDGWGSKFFYSVTDAFTGTNGDVCQYGAPETKFDFNQCNMGVLRVLDSDSGVKVNDAVFVILSFGQNRLGAYGKSVKNRINLENDQAKEFINSNLKNGLFLEKIIERSEDDSIQFDDILIYRTKNQILNKLGAVISNSVCDRALEILNEDNLLCGATPGDPNCAAYMSNLANKIKSLCL